MKNTLNILKAIDCINEWCGKVVSFLAYSGMVILLYEIIMRYVFHTSLIWTHQLAKRVFIVYYLVAGGHTLLYKAHINVDIIYGKLSLRKRAVLDLITSVFIIATGVVLIWKGTIFAWQSISILEGDTSAWNAPLYPVKIVIPIAGLLLLLQDVARFVRKFPFSSKR